MKRIKRYLATHCWLCGFEYNWNYSICLCCGRQARKFQSKWILEIIHKKAGKLPNQELDFNTYKPAKS